MVSIRSRYDEYKTSLARLSPRERASLGGLAATLGLVVVMGIGYFVYSGLEDLEAQNEAIRVALSDLQRHGQQFMQERTRLAGLEVRMSRTPLELNSYVEQAAKAVGVEIGESVEMQAVEVDRYLQRGLEVKLRKVTLEQLGKLLKQIESSPQIVQVTRLSVATRWGETKELDVELVVSTYERRPETPKGDDGAGARGRKRS